MLCVGNVIFCKLKHSFSLGFAALVIMDDNALQALHAQSKTCEYCGRMFANSSRLTYHLRKTSTDCNFRFLSSLNENESQSSLLLPRMPSTGPVVPYYEFHNEFYGSNDIDMENNVYETGQFRLFPAFSSVSEFKYAGKFIIHVFNTRLTSDNVGNPFFLKDEQSDCWMSSSIQDVHGFHTFETSSDLYLSLLCRGPLVSRMSNSHVNRLLELLKTQAIKPKEITLQNGKQMDALLWNYAKDSGLVFKEREIEVEGPFGASYRGQSVKLLYRNPADLLKSLLKRQDLWPYIKMSYLKKWVYDIYICHIR